MIKRVLSTLALASACLCTSAQAGVVTGDFDPAFGPALPGFSYKGSFTLTLSDAVIALGPLVAVGDGVVPLTVNITLYETLDPLNFVTDSIALDVQTVSIDVVTGLVTGWDAVAGPLNSPPATTVSLPGWDTFDIDLVAPGVQTHSFVFHWDSLTGGPFINCTTCNGGLGALASKQDLTVLTSQTADSGQLRGGVFIAYSDTGPSTTTLLPVPLPGTLALLVPGLALLAARRRSSGQYSR